MRPEISDSVIERLKEWAINRKGTEHYLGSLGVRGGEKWGRYTVEDALDDLLKEVGF